LRGGARAEFIPSRAEGKQSRTITDDSDGLPRRSFLAPRNDNRVWISESTHLTPPRFLIFSARAGAGKLF